MSHSSQCRRCRSPSSLPSGRQNSAGKTTCNKKPDVGSRQPRAVRLPPELLLKNTHIVAVAPAIGQVPAARHADLVFQGLAKHHYRMQARDIRKLADLSLWPVCSIRPSQPASALPLRFRKDVATQLIIVPGGLNPAYFKDHGRCGIIIEWRVVVVHHIKIRRITRC